MKRQATIWTILMLAPLLAITRVSHQAAMEIRSFDRMPIVVQMDGYTINQRPDASVVIYDIFPGNRNVRVMVPEWRGGRYVNRLLYNGYIQVFGNEQLQVVVGRNGRVQIDRRSNNAGWNGHGYGACATCGSGHTGSACGASPVGGYGQPAHGWNHPSGMGYYGQGMMSSRDLADVRRAMQRAGFDSSREDIAKTAVEQSSITSRQLRDMLEEFSFESTRLRFAKWAYPYVVDQDQIFRIYDAFQFNSSVQDFRRFIDRSRR